jgi:PKHD-type hydroxylase
MRISNYLYKENVLTKKECKKVINEGAKQLQKAITFNAKEEGEASSIRETNISFFESGSAVDNILQKVIENLCNIAFTYYGVGITDVEPIQYAEYEKGMFYGWHTDSGKTTTQTVTRDISASLILNDKSKYTGGSLQMVLPDMISKDNIITPQDVEDQEEGTLIVFPSSMIHRVTPVSSGIRKSLVLWSCSNIKFT